MDVNNCIEERRSVRRFTDEKVSHEDIEKIVELSSYSPSWKNSQIVRYIAVEDQALIKEIADNCTMNFAFNQKTMLNAPMLVVVTMVTGICGFEKDGSYSTSKKNGWEMFDAGIASQTFSLAAHSLGLGSVIFGVFDDEKVHQALNIVDTQKVATIIALGHPQETPSMPKRKSVSELLSFKD